MGLKKNQSAITHIEVAFREIDRFFDVHGSMEPGTSMRVPAMDEKGEPQIVIRDPLGIVARVKGTLSDENGEPINTEMRELPGVYRTLRTYGEAAFMRTFARWKSQSVDGKYVYVWAADDKKGGGMRLVRELFFKTGKFQLIDFNSKKRRPKGSSRERLVLDLISFQDAQPKQVYYFFLLARYQVPRKSLDDMMADLPARGVRLWDEFYTDYCSQGDLSHAGPVDGPPRAGQPLPSKLTYVVHLVDPFKEALHRSERYKNALHRWQQAEADLSKDPDYNLAKGIDFLRGTSAGQASPNSLTYSFTHYLLEREKEATRCLFVMCSLADDLVQWIGRAEKRESLLINGVQSDTWFGNSSNRIPSKEDKGADQWHSHYCQALLDYATPAGDLTADKNVAHKIGGLVCAAVDELEQSAYGDQWLKDVFQKGIDGKLDKLASGGYPFFFESSLTKSTDGGEGGSDGEAKAAGSDQREEAGGEGVAWPDVGRKGNEAVKHAVVGLLKTVGKHWVGHYRKDALSSLQSWYKAKHGIDLEELSARALDNPLEEKGAGLNRSERRALKFAAKRERRALELGAVAEFKKAKRRGLKRLELKPGTVDLWQFGADEFKLLQFGIEMVNLCHAVDEARDGKDPWKRLEALESALDASKALLETFHNEDYVSEVEEVASRAGQAIKVLGLAGAAIEVALGMHGIYEGQSVSEQVSEGMKTLGSALVFGGTIGEEHPVGMIVLVVGAGLQSLGSYWKAQANPVCEFLRNCRWGSGPSTTDSIGSKLKDENSYWYHGPLSALKDNRDEQLRCVDRFKYHYEPELEFEAKESSCKLKIRMKGASQSLGPAAVWDVRVELIKTTNINDDSGKHTVTLRPDSDIDDLDWTAEEVISYQALTPDEIVGSQGKRPTWWMQAKVHAQVDVAGDGKHKVEQEEEQSYVYAMSAPTPTPRPEYEYGTPEPTPVTTPTPQPQTYPPGSSVEPPDAGTPPGSTGADDSE
jgi:hypothetical protein